MRAATELLLLLSDMMKSILWVVRLLVQVSSEISPSLSWLLQRLAAGNYWTPGILVYC
jgi:hypothetical protein